MNMHHQKTQAAPCTAAPASALALGQGAYYLVTGVWPLLSMRTFEAVTGPKVDRWLVKTVGVLVAVIGAVLLRVGRRGRVSDEVLLLGAGSAAGLTSVDLTYGLRGHISKVYLLDALAEVLLLLGWGLALMPRHAGHRARRPFSLRRTARYLR